MYLFRFNPSNPANHSIAAEQAAILRKFSRLRNYLSLFAFVLFFLSGLIYILLRFSFNAYRGPSASSTMPSLELGLRFSVSLFFFHFVLITYLAHTERGLNVKVERRGREGKGWNSIPVCAFLRRIENAANGTSVCVKRAFVVNTFYVRSLLYRSLSARVKCQKISDSLVVRARPPPIYFMARVLFRPFNSERDSHRSRASRCRRKNGTPLLYNFSKTKIRFFSSPSHKKRRKSKL